MEHQYDHRSSIIKNNHLFFTTDGKPDARSAAVRDGSVLLTQDRNIDHRSSSFKNGDLYQTPTVTDGGHRRPFRESEKSYAFEKASPIPGVNPDVYRQDRLGNPIHVREYGKSSPMAWDVDHSKPLHKGATYHPNNLQAMQSHQNRHDKNGKYPYDYNNAPRSGSPIVAPQTDLRSQAVKSGGLYHKPDGTVDKNSSLVRNGDVMVTKDGNVDRRSRAVRDGRVL